MAPAFSKIRNMDIPTIPGYIFTTLIVYMQGSVILSGNRLLLLILLFISASVFLISKLKTDKELIIVFFFLLLVIFVQYSQFKYLSYNTVLGTLVRFILPYFLVKIIGKEYLTYYVNVIYFFAILSLILYISSILSPNFYHFLYDLSSNTGIERLQIENNLIVYSVVDDIRLGYLRNAGLFWEPGAYAGFLIMAVLFNIVKCDTLWNSKNIVFFIALLSTFSTVGYIVLFMTIIFYYLSNIRRKAVYYFLIPILCLGAWYSYFNMDFLGSRINSEIAGIQNSELEYSGRIGSGKKDLKDIVKYPFFGKGRNVATRFENYNKENVLEFHRTNGVTDFAVKYGLLFSLFYFFNIFKSFKAFCKKYRYNKRFGLLMLVIVLTIGFSQTFFQGIFFISLIYLHTVFKEPVKLDVRNRFDVKNFNRNPNLQQKAGVM